MKKKKRKNLKNSILKEKKPGRFSLPEETKKWVWGIVLFLIALIFILSFFDLAGVAGQAVLRSLIFLIGKTIFSIPLIFVLAGLIFLKTSFEKFGGPLILAILSLIFGSAGTLECLAPGLREGGWLGFLIAWPFLKFFGTLVAQIVFFGIIVISGIVFWHLLRKPAFLKKEEKLELEKTEKEKPLVSRIFQKVVGPKFKVKEIEAQPKEAPPLTAPELKIKEQQIVARPSYAPDYVLPPLDLLEEEKGTPSAGDIRTNAAIIKKTLQNFDIAVEMSEINIGPTVTQYTLKPAEGVKLSKITALSNDLALALASHPIRIEAPIPGRALVGIEVPNKVRAQVRLRNLISLPQFQKAFSGLTIALGRDVSGNPVFTDLAKMPHLLVAGSTGTGKTIFLNNLILSLLYQNSPHALRFILIDPKRVEFPVYNDLSHLLTPVVYDAGQTVITLKWLILEMERRFEVLSAAKARDIAGYNETATKRGEILPYIVLIVDELADLMAAKGREVEAGIVRLAQMARAVGIHLVVATQRPSVEVITGLIKANITSRITFQVASQVDSRTVLDAAGAEKLLGLGDLLYVSAEVAKPRRIQAAYVSDREVKKVVSFLKAQNSKLKAEKIGEEGVFKNELSENLERALLKPEVEFEGFVGEEDPLYEEAKRVVREARKASASLLQRRLRIGYARAARLIDILEERGVVGPGEGAKPREVYLDVENEAGNEIGQI